MEHFERMAGQLGERMPIHWVGGALPGAIRIDDLYELAGWLRGARIFVGNDSGVAHLAAAVGTPVVSLFPTGDPRVWSPRGVSCAAYSLSVRNISFPSRST